MVDLFSLLASVVISSVVGNKLAPLVDSTPRTSTRLKYSKKNTVQHRHGSFILSEGVTYKFARDSTHTKSVRPN